MNFAVISLIVFVCILFVGYKSKINTGLLSIACAMILGHFMDMADKTIIAGFATTLFVQLTGVMLLFSIASENNALQLIAKRAVATAGKRTYLIPLIVYFVAVFMAGIGCGCVPVMSLMAVFCAALAAEMKVNPVLLIPMGLLGAQGGGTTPLTTTGILGATLAAENGITEYIGTGLMMGQFLCSTLFAVTLYIVLKGYKIKADNPVNLSDIPKMSKKQKLSCVAILGVAICVLVFKFDVGLSSFVASVILLLLKTADQKKAIAGIPWQTLLLVCGINVLMNLVIIAGGIDLLANSLASIMTDRTTIPLIGATAGIMSWFSSTSGVVMPTLIPTVAPLLANMGTTQVTATAMVTAITATAHTAGVSPISSGGSMGLASYCSQTGCGEEEERKLFADLFGVAIGGVIFCTIFGFLGGFSIFH
ncbi:hypothetical protein O6R05_05105 [Peptoniphilus equinus]|uniref:Dicarboxylate carrier MatC N-terminal domain-containing protein n=1 Tax=Peptoniphilus equinus TaxID=3016343 RepID=A0ABY7QSE5_9FIRM|nr:SLC13 family permease [Peptoniphilus equinus]WBW49391.1 hypothetical protein O6R05_05105 [Peptoniphilus equinus]